MFSAPANLAIKTMLVATTVRKCAMLIDYPLPFYYRISEENVRFGGVVPIEQFEVRITFLTVALEAEKYLAQLLLPKQAREPPSFQ